MPFRIVYIDDEELICELFHNFFDGDKYAVTTFTSPDDALKHIEVNPPDIVFIDFRLTNTTGDKVAARMPSSIPKILITGDLKGELPQVFLKVIQKPFKFTDVAKFLEDFQKSTGLAS